MKTKLILCLLVLFVFSSFWSCECPGKIPNFIGKWINEDANTAGITKIVIRAEADSIYAHEWGKCTPEDCDWGEESTLKSDAEDGQLSLVWDQGFVIRNQKLTLMQDDRLKVDTHSHYTDDSGRPDIEKTEYFVRDNN